jgi:MarR family transcriptional regulator, 2-MHQ and catechol-resistance regulon repressor
MTRRENRNEERALAVWVKLARASATCGQATHAHIRTLGLTPPQFGVLEALGHLGPLSPGDLCRKQLVSGGNITVVLENMEKSALLTRKRDRRDRRRVHVALTPRGKRLFRDIFPSHAQFVGEMMSVLTKGEQVQLGLLLKKLGITVARRWPRTINQLL